MNREERMEQHHYRESDAGEHRSPPPQEGSTGQPGGQPRGQAGDYADSSAWTNPGGAYGGGIHGGSGGDGGRGYSSGGYGAQGTAGQGYSGYAPYGYGQGAQPPLRPPAPQYPQYPGPRGPQYAGNEPVRVERQGPGGPPMAQPEHAGEPRYGTQGYGQQGSGQQQWGQHGPARPTPPHPSQMGYSGASYGSEAYAGWADPGALREEGREPIHPRHRRGPKGYTRSDQRLLEEICDRLVQQVEVDPGDVEVRVQDGVVELEGSVLNRASKHRIEDIVDSVWGVKDIRNHLRIPGPDEHEHRSS